MNRIISLITFLLLATANLHSQDLFDTMAEVSNLINKKHYGEANAILDRVEKQCLESDRDSVIVLFYQSRGAILYVNEKFRECIPYFQKTIPLYERLNIKAQNYLNAFVSIGYSYGRLKDYENAERYYRKALLKSVTADFDKDFRHLAAHDALLRLSHPRHGETPRPVAGDDGRKGEIPRPLLLGRFRYDRLTFSVSSRSWKSAITSRSPSS